MMVNVQMYAGCNQFCSAASNKLYTYMYTYILQYYCVISSMLMLYYIIRGLQLVSEILYRHFGEQKLR